MEAFTYPPSLPGCGYGFDVRIFYTHQKGSSLNPRPQQWEKPRGCSMVFMWVLGGGGGGGGGFRDVAGSNRGGGGGGGAGGLATLLIPAFLVPDQLQVYVGEGGGGGAGGNPGNSASGQQSAITTQVPGIGYPFADNDCFLQSGTAAPGGGAAGAASGGAAGGAGQTIGTGAKNPLGITGNASYLAGQAGQSGASFDNVGGGSGLVRSSANFAWGGGGGAGVTATDRGVNTITDVGSYAVGNSNTAIPAGSNNGSDGFVVWSGYFPITVTQGNGGASSNNAAGGKGGNGAYGCGGGGGGGGISGGPNSDSGGGAGGTGLVIIATW
jgi:hypothetical protein